mmetsp:Transcript_14902/g.25236  ORF Transcript_14902/g.25236 Transcript_14902/m.25236 type:complete len:412 (-) Transcript_14902:436-1671(-)
MMLKPLEAVLVAGGFDVLHGREGEDVGHSSDPLKEVNEVHRTHLAPVLLLILVHHARVHVAKAQIRDREVVAQNLRVADQGLPPVHGQDLQTQPAILGRLPVPAVEGLQNLLIALEEVVDFLLVEAREAEFVGVQRDTGQQRQVLVHQHLHRYRHIGGGGALAVLRDGDANEALYELVPREGVVLVGVRCYVGVGLALLTVVGHNEQRVAVAPFAQLAVIVGDLARLQEGGVGVELHGEGVAAAHARVKREHRPNEHIVFLDDAHDGVEAVRIRRLVFGVLVLAEQRGGELVLFGKLGPLHGECFLLNLLRVVEIFGVGIPEALLKDALWQHPRILRRDRPDGLFRLLCVPPYHPDSECGQFHFVLHQIPEGFGVEAAAVHHVQRVLAREGGLGGCRPVRVKHVLKRSRRS